MSTTPEQRLELEQALARYRQAPESKLFAPLAAAYCVAGRPDEAARVLRAGLERHPHYVTALVLLGICHRDMQEDEAAEAVFSRVLELDAENLVALRYRAERARRRGALERAVELLRRALEIDPFDREVQADLGLLTTALERRVREAAGPDVGSSPQRTLPEVAVGRSEPAPPPIEAPPIWPGGPTPPPPEWPHAAPADFESPEPPRIDLRRVGSASEGESRFALPPPAVPEPSGESQPSGSKWSFSRQDDRIIVSPDTPVRGPIRSVEDRLWSERHAGRAAEPPPPETHFAPPPPPIAPAVPAPPPALPPPPAIAASRPLPPPAVTAPRPLPVESPPMGGGSGGEFATLTLARIYESQGYYQKALGIYDELLRQRPSDTEIAARRDALQRQLAGTVEPLAIEPAPVASPLEPSPGPQTEWRLLDTTAVRPPQETAQRLRDVTREARTIERSRHHTVQGELPPPAPIAPPAAAAAPLHEDVSRGHPDFERFLAYVRSLQREGSA